MQLLTFIKLFVGTRYKFDTILIEFGPTDIYKQFELQFSNNSMIDPVMELNAMISVPDNASLLGISLGANQSATITVVDTG